MVVLKRHTDSPTAGEWHRLESMARRRFPDYRWKRPTLVTKHFYIHAMEPHVRCGHDHTELEHGHGLAALGQSRREIAAVQDGGCRHAAGSRSPLRHGIVPVNPTFQIEELRSGNEDTIRRGESGYC